MLLNAAFHKAGADFLVPEVDWFGRLRERIGNESLLYAFVKVARAKEVLKFGSDETAIQRQGIYNQWVRIENDEGQIEVVYIETGGYLVGATAAEVTAHIEKTWQRGKAYIEALREELGEDAKEHVPLERRREPFKIEELDARHLQHGKCDCP